MPRLDFSSFVRNHFPLYSRAAKVTSGFQHLAKLRFEEMELTGDFLFFYRKEGNLHIS
jgi:hypothetical protein